MSYCYGHIVSLASRNSEIVHISLTSSVGGTSFPHTTTNDRHSGKLFFFFFRFFSQFKNYDKYVKFIILVTLSVQFYGIKYIHIVVQPLPSSISTMLLIFKTETLHLLNNNSNSLLPSAPATTILLSVCIILTILSASYKCKHIIFVFL